MLKSSKETQSQADTTEHGSCSSSTARPIQSYAGILGLSLLMACHGKDDLSKQFDKEGFSAVAAAVAPLKEGMDANNQRMFEDVLVLMSTELSGIRVERTDFSASGQPAVRAMTQIPRKFEDQNALAIHLDTDWNPNNGVDLAMGVHELLHASDVREAGLTMDSATWQKVYGAPGNATEIRTELRAWELQLVFLNQLSGGLLEEFYQAILRVQSQEEADQIVQVYVDKITQKVNAREDQKGMLRRWLEIYFNYRANDRFALGCSRWSYDFATQIAGEYERQEVKIYELDLNPVDQKSDPTKCVDPLPDGAYPYESFRKYAMKDSTRAAPSTASLNFGR